jgi:ABC-type sugar transport system permease subunit
MDPTEIPLRDLHLPEMIGWWPLAPAWWFLIVLAFAGLAFLLYRSFTKWRRNAARRAALKELARIQHEYRDGVDEISLAIELSELLRRSMLAYAPRNEVAGLAGASWLRWLDQGLDEKPFSAGPGQNVESLPYRSPEGIEDDVDVQGLINAVRVRLKTPLPAEAL